MAFLIGPPKAADCDTLHLWDERAYVAMSKGDALVDKEEVAWGDLQNRPGPVQAALRELSSELFLHGRTKSNDAEREAVSKAAPEGTNVVGVRIRSTHGETKLFRDGDYPCLRGTAIRLGDKDAFLWTTGLAPPHRHLHRRLGFG